jgi:hypothetical protein
MVYSGYQYHKDENKYIYSYGKPDDFIKNCGFIRANNKREAEECVSLLRRQWSEPNYIILSKVSAEDYQKEIARREAEEIRMAEYRKEYEEIDRQKANKV